MYEYYYSIITCMILPGSDLILELFKFVFRLNADIVYDTFTCRLVYVK